MIRGIYTAAAGLATAALRLGVVSNNVANASTPGYKQDRLPGQVDQALNLMRMSRNGDGQLLGTVVLGPSSGLAELDLSTGPLQETGNPLDLAVAGRGFFAVRADDGPVRYTRDGGFHVDATGALRTRGGAAVLDQTGAPIQLPAGAVEVGADGTLLADGQAVGRLMIVEFAAGQQLVKQGGGLFAPDGGALPQPAGDSQVYQGYLEGSNVDMTESMVAIMNLTRAYAANQRLLQLQDETLSRVSNEIGKV